MLIDWTPMLQVALLGGGCGGRAADLVAFFACCCRQCGARLRALTVLTAFLTFDLIAFGAFRGSRTRAWAARTGRAATARPARWARRRISPPSKPRMPTGPVTHGKAWVEMIHRYLAAGVGVLCIVLCVQNWRLRAAAWAVPAWRR